ncbi:MAG: hypothetical protein ABIS92_06110 [Polyangia bacterium]
MAQRDQIPDDTTRILIAEGDGDSRLALSWCLLSEGYHIDPVSDGFSAAAALEQPDLPAIAIVDLGLQGLGGRRLIEHILSSPRLRSIHIVATGFFEPFAPLPAGVIFLKKPCDGEVFLRTIRALGGEGLRSFFPSRREHALSQPPWPGVSGWPSARRSPGAGRNGSSDTPPTSHVLASSQSSHASVRGVGRGSSPTGSYRAEQSKNRAHKG